MNEAEDGGAESLASKFENQRHQFLYKVDTCRRAAERGGRVCPQSAAPSSVADDFLLA